MDGWEGKGAQQMSPLLVWRASGQVQVAYGEEGEKGDGSGHARQILHRAGAICTNGPSASGAGNRVLYECEEKHSVMSLGLSTSLYRDKREIECLRAHTSQLILVS